MTTTEYLQREIRRVELSIRRAEHKPNSPPEELQGLHEKLEHLQEALNAVEEHWQRVHEQRGWTAGEPLTLEQLRQMVGRPVWIEDKQMPELSGYGIMREDVCDGYQAVFFIEEYGKRWVSYAGQPTHIDREKWGPCKWCEISWLVMGEKYCCSCGRPLTDEAWAELERRFFGEV